MAANLVQAGWQLRVLSDDATQADWLDVHLVLHTMRGGGQSKRVWIYLADRGTPLIYEWDDVVHAREVW